MPSATKSRSTCDSGVPTFSAMLAVSGQACPSRLALAAQGGTAALPKTTWLEDLSYDSALAARLHALVKAGKKPEGGAEPAKADYTLTWPAGLDGGMRAKSSGRSGVANVHGPPRLSEQNQRPAVRCVGGV